MAPVAISARTSLASVWILTRWSRSSPSSRCSRTTASRRLAMASEIADSSASSAAVLTVLRPPTLAASASEKSLEGV